MATLITYSQRIEGRLVGPPAQNTSEIEAFKALLGSQPGLGKGTGWPDGFVQEGFQEVFKVVHWIAEASVGGENKNETVLSFLAVVSAALPGKLYENREKVNAHNQWFLRYREESWYLDLKAKLKKLNASMEKKLIDRIWFREYEDSDKDGGDN